MEPTKALFSLRGSAAALRLCLSQMHTVNTGLLMPRFLFRKKLKWFALPQGGLFNVITSGR